jgi:hypothetical protein
MPYWIDRYLIKDSRAVTRALKFRLILSRQPILGEPANKWRTYMTNQNQGGQSGQGGEKNRDDSNRQQNQQGGGQSQQDKDQAAKKNQSGQDKGQEDGNRQQEQSGGKDKDGHGRSGSGSDRT